MLNPIYRRLQDMRVIRVRHEVAITVGTKAVDIKAALAKVPDKAAIVDVDEIGGGMEGAVFVFEEETKEPAEQKGGE